MKKRNDNRTHYVSLHKVLDTVLTLPLLPLLTLEPELSNKMPRILKHFYNSSPSFQEAGEEGQDFYIINWTNTLENPTIVICVALENSPAER